MSGKKSTPAKKETTKKPVVTTKKTPVKKKTTKKEEVKDEKKIVGEVIPKEKEKAKEIIAPPVMEEAKAGSGAVEAKAEEKPIEAATEKKPAKQKEAEKGSEPKEVLEIKEKMLAYGNKLVESIKSTFHYQNHKHVNFYEMKSFIERNNGGYDAKVERDAENNGHFELAFGKFRMSFPTDCKFKVF